MYCARCSTPCSSVAPDVSLLAFRIVAHISGYRANFLPIKQLEHRSPCLPFPAIRAYNIWHRRVQVEFARPPRYLQHWEVGYRDGVTDADFRALVTRCILEWSQLDGEKATVLGFSAPCVAHVSPSSSSHPVPAWPPAWRFPRRRSVALPGAWTAPGVSQAAALMMWTMRTSPCPTSPPRKHDRPSPHVRGRYLIFLTGSICSDAHSHFVLSLLPGPCARRQHWHVVNRQRVALEQTLTTLTR